MLRFKMTPRCEYELVPDDGLFDPSRPDPWLAKALPSGSREWRAYPAGGATRDGPIRLVVAVRKGSGAERSLRSPLLSLSAKRRTGAFIYAHPSGFDVFAIRGGLIERFSTFDDSEDSFAALSSWIAESRGEWDEPRLIVEMGSHDLRAATSRLLASGAVPMPPCAIRSIKIARQRASRGSRAKTVALATLSALAFALFAASLSLDPSPPGPLPTSPALVADQAASLAPRRFHLSDLCIGLLAALPETSTCLTLEADMGALSCTIRGLESLAPLEAFCSWSGAMLLSATTSRAERSGTARFDISRIALASPLPFGDQGELSDSLQALGLSVEGEEWQDGAMTSFNARGDAMSVARLLSQGGAASRATSIKLRASEGRIDVFARFPIATPAEGSEGSAIESAAWSPESLKRAMARLLCDVPPAGGRIASSQAAVLGRASPEPQPEPAAPSIAALNPHVPITETRALPLPERVEAIVPAIEAPEWLILIARLDDGYAFKDARSGRYFIAGRDNGYEILEDGPEALVLGMGIKRFLIRKGGS
jgi:hypothetical protein